MRVKLFIPSISILLSFSCTPDESLVNQLNVKTKRQNTTDDDTSKNITLKDLENLEGDPVNPRPPRK